MNSQELADLKEAIDKWGYEKEQYGFGCAWEGTVEETNLVDKARLDLDRVLDRIEAQP